MAGITTNDINGHKIVQLALQTRRRAQAALRGLRAAGQSAAAPSDRRQLEGPPDACPGSLSTKRVLHVLKTGPIMRAALYKLWLATRSHRLC